MTSEEKESDDGVTVAAGSVPVPVIASVCADPGFRNRRSR